MSFDGFLKLIDVDGCVKIGQEVRVEDKIVSFSPCYCSPQWAEFLLNPDIPQLATSPDLDVWSVGLTIAELVSFKVVMQPMYMSLLKKCNSHKQAAFFFMDWLRNIKASPMPSAIKAF